MFQLRREKEISSRNWKKPQAYVSNCLKFNKANVSKIIKIKTTGRK